MDDIYRELGARIRAKRRQLDLTLEDLAERSGLPASYIGQVERGAKKASIRSIGLLARALGVPIGKLFSSDAADRDTGVRAQIEAAIRASSAAERKFLLMVLRQLAKGLKELR